MKTLLYANRAEPKSISVISILLLAEAGDITKLRCMHVISLLRKIFDITLYCNHLLFNIRIFTIILYICKHYLYNRVVQSNYPYDII